MTHDSKRGEFSRASGVAWWQNTNVQGWLVITVEGSGLNLLEFESPPVGWGGGVGVRGVVLSRRLVSVRYVLAKPSRQSSIA